MPCPVEKQSDPEHHQCQRWGSWGWQAAGRSPSLYLLQGMAEPFANELASAAARGDLVQVTNLLEKNVNVNAPNGFGRTALQVMKLGNPEVARRLLQRGADPDLKDGAGFAVLHDVARAGFLDTLQTVLSFQADVNVEDREGNLPLHLAAQEGHLPVVAFLLEHTPSRVQHRNRRGATALDLARLYKRHAVAQLLQEHPLLHHQHQ